MHIQYSVKKESTPLLIAKISTDNNNFDGWVGKVALLALMIEWTGVSQTLV